MGQTQRSRGLEQEEGGKPATNPRAPLPPLSRSVPPCAGRGELKAPVGLNVPLCPAGRLLLRHILSAPRRTFLGERKEESARSAEESRRISRPRPCRTEEASGGPVASPKGRCLRFFSGNTAWRKKKKHRFLEIQLGTKKGASAASRLDVMQLDSSRRSL